MDINVDLLRWYIHFSIKSLQVMFSKLKICSTSDQLKNYINQLLENLKIEKKEYKNLKKQDIIRKFEKRKEIIQKLKEAREGFTIHLSKQTK